MDIDCAVAWQFVAELTNSFEERHGFDIANRTADFAQHEIIIVIAFKNEVLDFIRDVRNDLNRRTEIIAAAFFSMMLR